MCPYGLILTYDGAGGAIRPVNTRSQSGSRLSSHLWPCWPVVASRGEGASASVFVANLTFLRCCLAGGLIGQPDGGQKITGTEAWYFLSPFLGGYAPTRSHLHHFLRAGPRLLPVGGCSLVPRLLAVDGCSLLLLGYLHTSLHISYIDRL